MATRDTVATRTTFVRVTAHEAPSLHRRPGMRWRYKRVDLDIQEVGSATFEAQLDQLGADGWELVTALQRARHGYSYQVHLLFKRAAEPVESLDRGAFFA